MSMNPYFNYRSKMDQLPMESMIRVLSYLPGKDVFSAMRVKRYFYYLIKKNWSKMQRNFREVIEFRQYGRNDVCVSIYDSKPYGPQRMWQLGRLSRDTALSTYESDLKIYLSTAEESITFNSNNAQYHWHKSDFISDDSQDSDFTLTNEHFLMAFLRYWHYKKMRFEKLETETINRLCELFVDMETRAYNLVILESEPCVMKRLTEILDCKSVSWNWKEHVHGTLDTVFDSLWSRRLYAPRMCTNWSTVIDTIHKYMSIPDRATSFWHFIVEGDYDEKFLVPLLIYNIKDVTSKFYINIERRYSIVLPKNKRVLLNVSMRTLEDDCGRIVSLKFG